MRRALNATEVTKGINAKLPDELTWIQGAVSTAVSGFESAIPDARSAVNGFATAIPEAIENNLPKNFSIGTRRFCIGLPHNVTCHRLPPEFSSIIPSEIRASLDGFTDIQLFDKAMSTITSKILQDLWVLGLCLIFIPVTLSICSMFGRTFIVSNALRIAIHAVFGVVFCIPFIVPVSVLGALQSKSERLPNWIEIREGNILNIFTGGLVCVLGIALLGTGIQAI